MSLVNLLEKGVALYSNKLEYMYLSPKDALCQVCFKIGDFGEEEIFIHSLYFVIFSHWKIAGRGPSFEQT